ncbi:hypothetical protein N9L06_04385 [Mariniblastus sp.]|nr:hypothetical protein [Mariniblastus sp.]
MKYILNVLIKVAIACLIVLAVWFIGNYMYLLPDRESVAAANSVAERYMQPQTTEGFSAVASGKQPAFPFEKHTFDIRDGERTVAEVQLSNFFGLGWQESSFSRAVP